MTRPEIQRLKQLPQMNVTWQVLALPAETTTELPLAEGLATDWAILIVELETGNTSIDEGGATVAEAAQRVAGRLTDCAVEAAGYRPMHVWVCQPALHEALSALDLDAAEIELLLVEETEALANMASIMNSATQVSDAPDDASQHFMDMLNSVAESLPASTIEPPALTAIRGLRPAHVWSLVAAGRLFHDAAPWELLEGHELLRVEAPAPPRRLAYANVMGQEGVILPKNWARR